MPPPLEIRILGVNTLDEHELRQELPVDAVRFIRPSDPDAPADAFPEPLTIIAVVLLGSQALLGLSAWALKKRHRQTLDYQVEVIDGERRETRWLHLDLSDASTDKEVIKQIGDSLALKPDTLAALIGKGTTGADDGSEL